MHLTPSIPTPAARTARLIPAGPVPGLPATNLSWLEFAYLLFLVAGGFLFLRDTQFWARGVYVGNTQFGDAQFWWDGALHFAQGIIADNPNLTYRMGYAAFGGLVSAVLGPDYHVFHQVLLALFLAITCGLYLSLRATIGRIAAAAAALFLVFNPFTAEWLATSTSDGLGLVLNLVALLALLAGVGGGLRLRWIAVFGIFFSCASLTRPLMTPFILTAALAIVAAGWGRWRQAGIALAVLLAAFVLPTLSWMGVMAATTGNFALTGSSQDSSTFYAASDPKFQTWSDLMYAPVTESARQHFGTAQPTPKQLNAEFWTLTRANYQKYWKFHLARIWHNAFELARFTPARADPASSAVTARKVFQWSLTLALGISCLVQRRWLAGRSILGLGALWALWPASQPWLVLTACLLGLVSLFFGRRDLFLWAAYWAIGVAALYLTGGTWGPPIGPVYDLNALGYRLGFQFFFLTDLLVIGLLGVMAQPREPAAPLGLALLKSAPLAGRLFRAGRLGFLGLFVALLGTGAAVVTQRIVSRARQTPVAYPDPSTLASLAVVHQTAQFSGWDPVRTAIATHAGEPLLMSGMSSGFIWNMAGQQRSWILLYQQDNVKPVQMFPRPLYVEVARHLPERLWMNRQGAWVLRSFPDIPQRSTMPYYIQHPAVQAFVPVAADGKSFDLAAAVVFPLAQSAVQLVAGGQLTISGAAPEWTVGSGALKFPRRFALHVTGQDQTIQLQVSLAKAVGARSLRFGVALESASGQVTRATPAHVRVAEPDSGGGPLWEADLTPNAPAPLEFERAAPKQTRALAITAVHLQPGDTLWFYELVLEADDFTW